MIAAVDWQGIADALIRVWNEIGMPAAAALVVAALVWKALDAWSRRGGKS